MVDLFKELVSNEIPRFLRRWKWILKVRSNVIDGVRGMFVPFCFAGEFYPFLVSCFLFPASCFLLPASCLANKIRKPEDRILQNWLECCFTGGFISVTARCLENTPSGKRYRLFPLADNFLTSSQKTLQFFWFFLKKHPHSNLEIFEE